MPRAVILTALPVEYLAVRAHLSDLQEEMHPQGTIYERGKFAANGQVWEVGIAEVGAGNAGAAVEAERAIAHFKPDVLFFVGIAGGVKDVAIGDVVAATKVYAYESGRVENQFFTRPALGLSTYALVQRARAEARRGEWLQSLITRPVSPPRVFIAPIAAGEKVIASKESEIFNFVRASYNDAIAVDMEGFGFLNATFAYPSIKAIVIRGISDLIEGKNDDSIELEQIRQEQASHHASAFAFEILTKISVERPAEGLLLPATDTPTQRVQPFVSEACPYQGLKFFDENTKKFFFGRERIVEILRQKLSQVSFVPVIGNSGSGKSSLVRAGLIPCLRSESDWRILSTITPSIDPLGQLKQALRSLFQDEPEDLLQLYEAIDDAPNGLENMVTKLPEMERILLVVDQFEEIFTLCPQGKEVQRDRFIQLLTQVAELHPVKLAVVVIIRADFISTCLRYESFTQLIQQQALYLPVLNQEELQEAIIHPAEIQGYELEDGLVEVILEDMRQEPEFLPLLQFTLTELWNLATEQEHQLTLKQYRNLGRLAGALNQQADALYFDIGKRLGEQGQLWVKRILLSLVRTGVETKDTRQRQPKADLLTIAGDKTEDQRVIAQVLNRLIQKRLLVTGGEEDAWVDLSHEALIEGWHRFAKWREEDRDLRRLSDRVRDVYQEWLKHQQEDQFLLMGGLLAQTQNRWNELEPFLPPQIKDFYNQSVDYKKIREQEGLQSSSFIGTFISQIDGYITETNDWFLQILGYSREEFTSSKIRWMDITPSEYLYIDEQRLAEANQRGECTPHEKELIRKDGSRASVKVSYSLRGGEKDTFFALVLDLTERRQLEEVLRKKIEILEKENSVIQQMEAALRESEYSYPMLAEALPQLIWIEEPDGQIQFQLLYETTRDLLSSTQPLDLVETVFNKLKGCMGLDIYLNYVLDAGQQKLHLISHGGISKAVAQCLEWLDLGQSICGTAAQQRSQIVHTGIQNSNDPKAQFARSLGLTAFACQPLIAQSKLFGTLSFGSLSRTEFTASEQSLLQAICDQMAIALERADLLNSLHQQTEELMRVNRIKDEFLAVLSHELRTPLNPILGWSRLLQTSKLDEVRTQQALAKIEQSAKLQVALIEDLLDVSRIQQGKMMLNIASMSLASIIEAAIETVQLSVEAKSIDLQFTILESTDGHQNLEPSIQNPKFTTLGDSTRLQQVVWNLLSNAVKFTPVGGRIEVRLEEVKSKKNSNDYSVSMVHAPVYAQISVSDTGKGITRDFLPYVFNYFRQEDSTTTRQFGGLGLGLAIVRHLVELHGGNIGVNSPGKELGATFIVQLPLTTISTEPDEVTSVVDQHLKLNQLRILVVDDDVDIQELAQFILEQQGAEVAIAKSAIEALSLLDRQLPDIVISDIGMPEMDGYMLMKQIRSRSPEKGGYIPAIALTAYAGEINQQQALAVGFQQHVTKPIDPEVLIAAIVKVLEKKAPKSQKNFVEATDKQILEDNQPQNPIESEFGKQDYKELETSDQQSSANRNEKYVKDTLNELIVDKNLEIYKGQNALKEQNGLQLPDWDSNASINLSSVLVLIVDDDLNSLEVSAFALEQAGCQLITASSAGEALDLLNQFKPDVLVSDIWMPGEDGYSLIQKIRELDPEQGGQVPAIALTAYAGEPDQQRALSVGFQIHLPKPVNPPSKLVVAVAKLARKLELLGNDESN